MISRSSASKSTVRVARFLARTAVYDGFAPASHFLLRRRRAGGRAGRGRADVGSPFCEIHARGDRRRRRRRGGQHAHNEAAAADYTSFRNRRSSDLLSRRFGSVPGTERAGRRLGRFGPSNATRYVFSFVVPWTGGLEHLYTETVGPRSRPGKIGRRFCRMPFIGNAPLSLSY